MGLRSALHGQGHSVDSWVAAMLSGVLVVATICVEESVEGRGGAVSTWLALVVAEFCSTCFLGYKLWYTDWEAQAEQAIHREKQQLMQHREEALTETDSITAEQFIGEWLPLRQTAGWMSQGYGAADTAATESLNEADGSAVSVLVHTQSASGEWIQRIVSPEIPTNHNPTDYAAKKSQAEETIDGIVEEEKANAETLTEVKPLHEPLVDVGETVTAELDAAPGEL